MAFNITSWGSKGRNFGRGAPPPRGSIEYVAVGDMWQAEPPRRSEAATVAANKTPDATPPTPTDKKPSNVPLYLAAAGVGYLGIAWLMRKVTRRKTTVAVPDAYREE